jgi:uncharacterized phage protein gp47/JayE
MIFRKDYGDLMKQSLQNLLIRTSITNQTVGGIARSLLEVVNLNLSQYYNVLDVNTAMGFVSTAEGYFLDLIGDLFNMDRLDSSSASASASDSVQLFYVSTGTLDTRIPSLYIPQGTVVSTSDGTISFTVSSDAYFSAGDTQVYAPISAQESGSGYNVGVNTLVKHDLGLSDVFTTNQKVVTGGSDTESDENFRYRIINATLSAAKANETAVRLAALSVSGVANVLIKEYARGIGTFDMIVIPTEGIATDALVASVQSAIDSTQAFGIKGTAIKPDVVTVQISARLVFVNNTTDTDQETIRQNVQNAISQYIVNLPIGGTFVYNKLVDTIMDTSEKIEDLTVTCYYFRGEPVSLGNVSIYWNEMFYPDPDVSEPIIVL